MICLVFQVDRNGHDGRWFPVDQRSLCLVVQLLFRRSLQKLPRSMLECAVKSRHQTETFVKMRSTFECFSRSRNFVCTAQVFSEQFSDVIRRLSLLGDWIWSVHVCSTSRWTSCSSLSLSSTRLWKTKFVRIESIRKQWYFKICCRYAETVVVVWQDFRSIQTHRSRERFPLGRLSFRVFSFVFDSIRRRSHRRETRTSRQDKTTNPTLGRTFQSAIRHFHRDSFVSYRVDWNLQRSSSLSWTTTRIFVNREQSQKTRFVRSLSSLSSTFSSLDWLRASTKEFPSGKLRLDSDRTRDRLEQRWRRS